MSERKRLSWRKLKQWQDASPWTVPVELAQMRDPFRVVEVIGELAARDEAVQGSDPALPEDRLSDLDVKLTGTIVGRGRRVALLDGRAYREGDVVRVEQFGSTWELEIRRIEANRVFLAWHSVERVLTAPKRPRVGRIELVERSR